MTRDCACNLEHPRRRIVLTGGPGAGKTAVLELVRQSVCRHVTVLPESAGIVFGGGFPRRDNVGVKQAAQRAIYHVQRELESAAEAEGVNIVLCDRGCVDGAAYWIGVEDFWTALGTTREALLARYDVVVHLRVPGAANGYGHQNPLRVESVAEALAIDERILRAWEGHPRRYVVNATPDFLAKAERAVEILLQELPECCRQGAGSTRETRLMTIDG
jgi:predicted ATPase